MIIQGTSEAAGLSFIRALQRRAELEYFAAPTTGSQSRTPIVIWRYAKPSENEMAPIHRHVAELIKDRAVKWVLRKTGRNWMLAPSRYVELEESLKFRTYADILDYLEATDASFGSAANLDLHAMTQQLIGLPDAPSPL